MMKSCEVFAICDDLTTCLDEIKKSVGDNIQLGKDIRDGKLPWKYRVASRADNVDYSWIIHFLLGLFRLDLEQSFFNFQTFESRFVNIDVCEL